MQNRSIWIIEYYDDYSGQWVNTGFFFSKEEAKEYCDLKNNSGAFHTYHYNEKKELNLQEYKDSFYTIWYVRIVEWDKVVLTDMDLSRHIPDYYIDHWNEKDCELGFCLHSNTEEEAIELALERAKIVKAEYERVGNFNRACQNLDNNYNKGE